MVADPTNLSSSRYTSPGHSLLYLSGVCPASPIRARLCRPGEQGSILTSYPNFHEVQPYRWNLVPASLYLHGSLTPGARLLYGSPYVKQALELHAREDLLQTVCQTSSESACPELPHSYWRDLVAATVDRDIFLYAVHTTAAQDQSVVDWLNHDANVNHYSILTNNCADFASSLVNAIFPHSVHRDLLNDIGMMTPKAAARSFTSWALKHPELGFYSLHFAQLPGDVRRSGLARSGTETVIHTKKYLIPAVVLGDWELPTSIVASYLFTSRFSLYNAYTQHSTPAALEENNQAPALQLDQQPAGVLETDQTALPAPPQNTSQVWASYRQRFAVIEDSPEARTLTASRKRFFPQPYATATATVDRDGLVWLTPNPAEPARRVGLGSQNLLSPDSDPELSFQLMLGRVRYALAAKNRMRESLQEFRQDWTLLEQTQLRLHAVTTETAVLPLGGCASKCCIINHGNEVSQNRQQALADDFCQFDPLELRNSEADNVISLGHGW